MSERTHQRQGKIARLPAHIREQVNMRLNDGEPHRKIIDWLHDQPAVLAVLGEYFGGRDIRPNNLSEWVAGGYQDWLDDVSRIRDTRNLADYAAKLTKAGGGDISDGAHAILVGKLMAALESAEAEDLGGFIKAVGLIRGLDIDKKKLALHQAKHDLRVESLELQRDKFETQTVATFLKWAEKPAAQAILNSGDSEPVQMDQLRQLFFGTEQNEQK